MNLQELLDYINFVANKDQRGGTLKPAKYNTALASANIKLFLTELGLEEQYQPGMPMPRRVWEITQNITEALRRFKIYMGEAGTMPLQVNSDGWGTLPKNYAYPSALRYRYVKKDKTTRDIPVDVLTDKEASDRLQSIITTPTLRYPIAIFHDDHIQFYPKNIQFVQFIYLRLPVQPVYGFSVDANDNVVYVPATSTELEWGDEYHYRIANIILDEWSTSIKDAEVAQFAEKNKIRGE